MKTTSTISGVHTRYDVKTKCTVVHSILTHNPFKTKKELNEYIESLAESIYVHTATIKLWIQKYQHTYNEGMKLPDGVMSYSFLTVPEYALPKTKKELQAIRDELITIRERNETTTMSIKPSLLRKNTKPKDILNKLIKG